MEEEDGTSRQQFSLTYESSKLREGRREREEEGREYEGRGR